MEDKKIERAKAWAAVSIVVGMLLTIAVKLVEIKLVYIIGVGLLAINLLLFSGINIKVNRKNLEGSTPNKLLIIYNTLINMTILFLLIISLSAMPY